MSDELRVLAFGALDGSLWAAALLGERPALVLGTPDAGLGLADGLTAGAGELSGDGVALRIAELPAVAGDGPGVTGSAAPGQALCRVTGTVAVGDAERELDCVGTLAQAADPGAGGSARAVSGWFSDEEALCVLATRPRGARDHGSDAIAASLLEPTGWIAVTDPRLSTTYDATGAPTRANLELWIGDDEEEFPRRAAGEVSGPGGSVGVGDGSLQVSPLGCHSRGEEGAGVYVLLSR